MRHFLKHTPPYLSALLFSVVFLTSAQAADYEQFKNHKNVVRFQQAGKLSFTQPIVDSELSKIGFDNLGGKKSHPDYYTYLPNNNDFNFFGLQVDRQNPLNNYMVMSLTVHNKALDEISLMFGSPQSFNTLITQLYKQLGEPDVFTKEKGNRTISWGLNYASKSNLKEKKYEPIVVVEYNEESYRGNLLWVSPQVKIEALKDD